MFNVVKRDSCNNSLTLFWKELTGNIPSPYTYKSGYGARHGSHVWCNVVVVEREERVFSLAFEISFPEFPFYYKTSLWIKAKELHTNLPALDPRINREHFVKLSGLGNDFYIPAEGKNDTYVLDKRNARYLYDQAQAGFELLDSLYYQSVRKLQ